MYLLVVIKYRVNRLEEGGAILSPSLTDLKKKGLILSPSLMVQYKFSGGEQEGAGHKLSQEDQK